LQKTAKQLPLPSTVAAGVKSRKNQSIRNTRCQPLAKYKAVFSSNLGVDNSALKSRVTVFSSVSSPKTNSILFRLLYKFNKLSARSVEQVFYRFKSSALLRSKDFDHYKNKAR